MKMIRPMVVFVAVALLITLPAHAQTIAYDVHYQTIVNPEAIPPLGPAFGDMYLKITADGSVSGSYRRFDGAAYGETFPVYGSRVRNSINLQLRLDPVLTVSAFVDGDRVDGTASDGRTTVGFRALAVP